MRRSRVPSSLVALIAVVALSLTAACSSLSRGPSPEPTPAPTTTGWQPGDPVIVRPDAVPDIVGLNYHPLWDAMDASTRSRVLDGIVAAGVDWIRLDVGWHNIQPTGPDSYDLAKGVPEIDERIAEARRRGLRVLLMFYWAPEWSSGTSDKNGRPGDPRDYARAAAWVAERYSGKLGEDLRIDALELWNEPDLNRFWVSEPAATQVSDFAALVRIAGRAVKDVNPALTVVVGGVSELDTGWLKRFYDADPGVGTSYDVLGVHAYPSPGDSPPEHLDPAHPEYSMRTITQIGETMTARGDSSPIWVTEFGWSTHRNTPVVTQAWQRGVSKQQQADYLLDSMAVLTAEPRVAAVFWYNAWSPPIGDQHMDGFGLLDADFRRKPAYFVMRCLAAKICGPS